MSGKLRLRILRLRKFPSIYDWFVTSVKLHVFTHNCSIFYTSVLLLLLVLSFLFVAGLELENYVSYENKTSSVDGSH